MSVKVGLVTSASAPKPSTRPFTNCVLPAPSWPTRATPSPCRRPAVNSRAILCVSAGLTEVNVATAQFSILDCRLAIEPADPGQRNFWEFFSPPRQQRFRVFRRNRKKKLVIFSVGNRLRNSAATIERQRRFINFETHAAGASETRQVGSESVAQVHHRVNAKIFGEPARFGDARDEVEVMAAQRSAEPAGDKKFVARFTAASSDPSRFLDASGDAHRNNRRALDVTCQ